MISSAHHPVLTHQNEAGQDNRFHSNHNPEQCERKWIKRVRDGHSQRISAYPPEHENNMERDESYAPGK